jgi:hypothetical protein
MPSHGRGSSIAVVCLSVNGRALGRSRCREQYQDLEVERGRTVNIDHKEPSLKYTATGTERQGNPSNIQFSGATDASEYLQKSIFSVIAVLRAAFNGRCMASAVASSAGLINFRDSRIVDMRGEFLLHVRTISIDKTPASMKLLIWKSGRGNSAFHLVKWIQGPAVRRRFPCRSPHGALG